MFRKDGHLIIVPDAVENLQPFIVLGLTQDFRVGVYWPNDQLRHALINRLTPAEMQKFHDGLSNALMQSIRKRMPAVINVS
jgi:hypothetical protein